MTFPFDDDGALARAGLNLHAVFDLAALPGDVRAALLAGVKEGGTYRQVILLGHGGRALWEAVEAQGHDGPDPIDTFCRRAASACLKVSPACSEYEFLYPPSSSPVPLVRLGELAGWHHASPFLVGINAVWGSWFAYRALILADSSFTPVAGVLDPSPCDTCRDKPCKNACPAAAVTGEAFLAARCFDHRLAPASGCSHSCQARLACPVGRGHSYSADQVRYHYGRSLETLRDYRKQRLV